MRRMHRSCASATKGRDFGRARGPAASMFASATAYRKLPQGLDEMSRTDMFVKVTSE
jgi:hypothetical protein